MSLKALMKCSAVAALCAGVLAPLPAISHHGVTGQFDLDQTVSVSGVVTRVRFVNPHSYVYFDATNDAGEVEKRRCEFRSGSLLKRKGWTQELFAVGTTISVVGSPDRRDDLTCYAETVSFEDGRTLSRYGSIAADGSFLEPEPGEGAEEARPAVAAASGTDFSGNWGEPVADGPPIPYAGPGPAYALTQAAMDAGDDWTSEANPRFKCEATNIILDYRFDQMLNKFEQTDDALKITYGFMDVERTIHIGGAFPEALEPSLTGYSVGTFGDDGKLSVMTKGFAAGFLQVIGGRSNSSVPHSDQMEIAETFYIDDAGELVREYTITDPVFLAEPYVHLDKAVKSADAFIPYDCDDLTVEN